MSDLDLTIELDPAPAATAAKKVVDEFGKAEDQGIKAKQAYESLSQTFRRLGQAMLEESRRGSQAIDNLGSSLARVGRLQALDAQATRQAMAEKSAAYASFGEQLARVANYQRMLNEQAAKTISLPTPRAQGGGLGAQLLDQVKGGLSPSNIASGVVGGLVGGGLAVGAITDAINGWREHEKAVEDSERMLRKYFDTARETAAVVEEQDRMAKLLNVDLREQAAAFGAVHEATSDLLLTTRQQTQASETLAEIMKLNGKGVSDVGVVMQQLQLAMSTGSVNAGQLIALLKQYPDVISEWAQAMGTSNKGLIEMAKQGKLGSDTIERLMDRLADGTETHKKYDEAFRPWVAELKPAADAMDELNGQMAAATAGMFALTPATEDARNATKSLGDIFEEATIKAARLRREIERRTMDDVAGGVNALRDLGGQAYDQFNKLFNGDGWTDSLLSREMKALGLDAKHATGEVAKLRAQVEAVWGSPLGRLSDEEMAKPGIAGLLREQAEAERAAAAERAARYAYAANGAPVDQTSGFPTYAQAIASANAPAKELEQHVTSINDLFADQLVGSAKTFSDTLVDAANGADVSWSNFGRNLLVTFEKMITQALVLKAITGSVTGTKGADGWGGLIGALGFSTGGDALAGVSGLHRIPAAATGYDGIVPGAGSTDSRLAMIRVTPGESIHVRTPEQRRAASTPSGSTTIQNVFQFDKRSLLPILSSPDGKAAIVNVVRENPELMRALLR